MAADPTPVKRSLILAGGGIKVAFQAGVLQVWLDEAGLSFDHADGASGGVFNLAMWCQEMTGTDMADNWRNLDPNLGLEFNWDQYARLFYGESLFRLDKFRENVFPFWKLDWDRIRSTTREATFNVYNFTRHELEVITAKDISEKYLIAAVSLPMWFPPVRIKGNVYIDAVYLTDANLEEAVRRGADELWIIWTVSERGEWNDGFVANYFQIIEAAANGHFKKILRRIEANNAAMERGGMGEFGRHVECKMLKAEVPLHYLINFSRDRLAEAVNLGVKTAREWCTANALPLPPSPDDYPIEIHDTPTSLSFTEEMKGYVSFGETDFYGGFNKGRQEGNALKFRLTIHVDGVDRFVTHPDHEAQASGYVEFEPLGGRLEVERGIFNLFVHEDDPAAKRMLYRLYFSDDTGHRLTLSGHKDVKDDPGLDLWDDTTTLFTRILRGHVRPEDEEGADVVASGILKIHLLDFLKQLTTFRVEGPTLADKTAALQRFGRLFLGKLWDVYAREVLTSSPF